MDVPDPIHHFDDEINPKCCIMETRIPQGMVLVQHKHAYPHLSVLVNGSCFVTFGQHRNDKRRQFYSGYSVLVIPAGEHHSVEATSDCIWLCVSADKPELLPADDAQMRMMVGS